jgi:hypothetical protein
LDMPMEENIPLHISREDGNYLGLG